MKKPSFNIALFGVVLTTLVVILGAFTRLSDAGLGCPDWPTCYGHLLWPDSEHEINTANEKFRDFNANLDTTVDTNKTWPEQVHRIFATSLGLLVIVLVIFAWLHRNKPGQPFKLPIFMLFFVIMQGIFGKWTVDWLVMPQVVTTHLLGGFTTLSLMWLLTQRLANWHWTLDKNQAIKFDSLKKIVIWCLLLVIIQISLGGWTAANYAALACPDLPTCHGQWLPPMDLKQGFDLFHHSIGPNYLGGVMDNEARTAIHFLHRVGAVIITLFVLMLAVRLYITRFAAAQRIASLLIAVLLLQLLLGLSNVYFALPLPVAVAHNAGGALLLLVMVTITHRLFTIRIQP